MHCELCGSEISTPLLCPPCQESCERRAWREPRAVLAVAKTEEELRELLRDAPRPFTTWVHYKGSRYVVIRSVVREHDLAPCVVYARIDASDSRMPRPAFIRPLAEWTELVEHEGQRVPRFRQEFFQGERGARCSAPNAKANATNSPSGEAISTSR